MSTTLTATTPALAPRATAPSASTRTADGARGLSALLLAALVATLVVIADQVIGTWADGHLLLAWVLLWAVIFAGLAFFADSARRVARRTIAALDSWSRSMAEARADMRLWEMARQDPRLMSELMAARDRDPVAAADPVTAEASPLQADSRSYWERLVASRTRQAHLHYV